MMKGKKSGLICEHCGYKGHQKENCCKIVGYSLDFKSKKKPMQGTGFRTYVKQLKEIAPLKVKNKACKEKLVDIKKLGN